MYPSVMGVDLIGGHREARRSRVTPDALDARTVLESHGFVSIRPCFGLLGVRSGRPKVGLCDAGHARRRHEVLSISEKGHGRTRKR
jgi:hypothetical protein